MIKNIIIGLLLAASISLVIVARVQRDKANQYRVEAAANLEIAKIQQQKALEQEELAMQKAAEARIESRKAQDALEELKKRCE